MTATAVALHWCPRCRQVHGERCPQAAVTTRAADVRRGTAHQRGYGRKWRETSAAYLAAHPLCRECEQLGRTTAATVTDHIVPHRGDMKLFWDAANWQPLCGFHHGRKTGRGQ
jgi:5-methylcytosine-specific restriction protein A